MGGHGRDEQQMLLSASSVCVVCNWQNSEYFLRFILVVADLDVYKHILCVDTSEYATTNMEPRE